MKTSFIAGGPSFIDLIIFIDKLKPLSERHKTALTSLKKIMADYGKPMLVELITDDGALKAISISIPAKNA